MYLNTVFKYIYCIYAMYLNTFEVYLNTFLNTLLYTPININNRRSVV